MDPNSFYRQVQILHELFHIASSVAMPWSQMIQYPIPTLETCSDITKTLLAVINLSLSRCQPHWSKNVVILKVLGQFFLTIFSSWHQPKLSVVDLAY